jgi:penicillin amidase
MSILHGIAAPVLRTGLNWLGRRRLPQTSGSLTVPGLSGSVKVVRDQWGVPHIYADNLSDLFCAQGFIHAQDRLWQMELNRRTAAGRLSEVFGQIALDTDRTTRAFGFHRLGLSDWSGASADVREAIHAYTKGVNAYLSNASGTMPVEFTLLGHKPEPWSPEDSMALSRIMIWQLSHAWYGAIVRAQMIEAVGAEHATELEIHYPTKNPVTLPVGIEFNRIGTDGSLIPAKGPFLQQSMGSNAWTVSGSRTITGKPFLCNDMHLPLGMPCLWYLIHLVSGGYQVTGASLPGLPMVLVGHNARIAWGVTLAYTDCDDLYVEEFNPNNSRRYRFNEEWHDAEVISEAIGIKGKKQPHIEEVLVTRHGPIISDVAGYTSKHLAIQSMALRPCPAVEGWLKLNHADNWNDFVKAMRLIEAPQLNIAYADVDGNIGYWVTGRVPVRAKGNGLLPVSGWTDEYEWAGEVPFEQMPHALNPSQGFVVTCNHCIIPKDYPYFLGSVWMNGYRARRIVTYFNGKDKLSPDDFASLHVDFTCIPGLEFVEKLNNLESSDPDAKLALELLRAWDGKLTTNSIGGSVYEVTRYHLVRNLLEPGLGKDLTIRMMGQGFHPLLMAASEFYGHDTVVMLRMLDNPDSWWLRQSGGREAVIMHSLKQAVEWLRKRFGNNTSDWQWGELHLVRFQHPLGMQKPLDRVFDRGPLAIGGDTDTPCQTAILPDNPYENKAWAPTFRQIVDMKDLSRSIVIIPPGQSGQLGSPHYDDLVDLWIKGKYIPMLWTQEQIQVAAEAELILKP